jgi:hypothetical protein
MLRRARLLALLIPLLLPEAGGPASASTTKTSPGGVATNAYAGVGEFGDNNGYYGTAASILGGQYVLTARHCVTTDGSITGTLKDATTLRFLDGGVTYTGTAVFANFGADIAVVRINQVDPNSYGLWSAADGNEVGKSFVGVGFGETDANNNGLWDDNDYGTKHYYENIFDSSQVGPLAGQGTVLKIDYDKTTGVAVNNNEGLFGPGDSGGPGFLSNGSTLLIAGVHSSSGDPEDQSTGSLVQISAYRTQILQAVPEPSTALMCVTAAVALTAVGRRRARAA